MLRKITIAAKGKAGKIGHGTHKRVIIKAQKFPDRTYCKL